MNASRRRRGSSHCRTPKRPRPALHARRVLAVSSVGDESSAPSGLLAHSRSSVPLRLT